MKKLFTCILLVLFSAGFAGEVYTGIYSSICKKESSIALEDAKEEKGQQEKEEKADKDKLITACYSAVSAIKPSQKFYLTRGPELPQPLCERDIIPPEAASTLS